MGESNFERNRVGSTVVAPAAVLLAGIVITAVAYIRGGGVAGYVGLLITLVGVMIGIQQLVLRSRS